ncbi:hypothetical protein K491DRAFT_181411 [Lophiostoma macrostomum CBS 122681]|uniref:Uncharacterized protein n=1 Tax=Lophiostoma macrostomum CBS 122681 TaxID=1314788 RepID=A0A6A6TUH7_9PLEO|nr:hypothetical protein K491DRAFT_181411 [Lophiostoma macrostomum CBS 122681]
MRYHSWVPRRGHKSRVVPWAISLGGEGEVGEHARVPFSRAWLDFWMTKPPARTFLSAVALKGANISCSEPPAAAFQMSPLAHPTPPRARGRLNMHVCRDRSSRRPTLVIAQLSASPAPLVKIKQRGTEAMWAQHVSLRRLPSCRELWSGQTPYPFRSTLYCSAQRLMSLHNVQDADVDRPVSIGRWAHRPALLFVDTVYCQKQMIQGYPTLC